MSALKQLTHLDYAVYGNVIVPMLMFDVEVMFRIYEDSDEGKCRIISRVRRRK
ncbi:hypothetical protein [Paenibacillus sp. J2TS4]|uniref:hypothetical protein n=1 Tax=Paenibacillus sp. J2TS4 TaxID=2807194 RepID=UPI001B2E49A2|nr:hypothetical protein [Paenibacillus sp. J2TS4]GIP33673.1 hypothetical protein J2TS4_28830 [Paenibacillus sp. J2TS4]